jgi:hypothetical protein
MYESYNLYNIILFCIKTIRQLSPVLHHKALKTLKPMKLCINGGNAIFLVITRIARLLLLIGLMSCLSMGLLTKSLDLRSYYSLGNLIHCYGGG